MAAVRVKGLSELQKLLETLPAKLEANVMRGALGAGAKVIRAEARRNAPVGDSGLLRGSIRVESSIDKRTGKVTASVKAGSRSGKKKSGPPAFYAGWVEYGTAAHSIAAKKGSRLSFGGLFAGSVDHPGARPKPFMRPALDTRAQDAVVAAAEYMKKRLQTKHGLDTAHVEIEAEAEAEE